MASAQDRTEQATPRRREEARKKGQVAKSHDLVAAVGFLVGVYALRAGITLAQSLISGFMRKSLTAMSTTEFAGTDAMNLLSQGAVCALVGSAPVALAAMASGIAVNVAQVGLMLTPNAIAPQFKRVDPIAGFGRLFSKQAIIELARSAAKALVIGYFGYKALMYKLPGLIMTSHMELVDGVAEAGDVGLYVILRMALPMVLLGGVDYGIKRYQFEQELKMSKQEVKQELREQEGDPLIRSRIRQRQRQLAMRRMMEDVKTADVVITNPTHYAVAVKYDGERMRAPFVVAKGQRLIAQRIREIAELAGVPIVENPPVAQALFRSVDIGREIPPDLYRAVAEVLAFVYRAGGRGR